MTDDADQLLALAERLDKAAGEIAKQVTEVHAVADELVALAGEDGEVEPPEPPDPLPDLILSRSNVTAVETLPVGALLGCRMITAAVTFHKPPGAKNEKLVGADSTANAKGGMCMERTKAGQYSIWVQADDTKMVQLPAPEPGAPTFVTFELTDAALAGSVGETDGNFTQLPREPDPFDGPAALLAGYWMHQQCDQADATIHELRAYRTWSEAQIEADRDAWAALFPPDNGGNGDGGGNGGEPPPVDGLEPVDPQLGQVAMIAHDGECQRWDGFGLCMSSPSEAEVVATKIKELKLERKLFQDIGTTWLASYGATLGYKNLAAIGKANGADRVFMHGFLWRANMTPASMADQVKAAIAAGINIQWVCLQNEPDGHHDNQFQGYPTNFDSVVKAHRELRAALDARGLKHVEITTNPYAHFGEMCDREWDALRRAGVTPDAMAGHCYSDCPTEENWQRAKLLFPIGMMSTETGYGDAANSPARFFAAVNNGASGHAHFLTVAPKADVEAMKNVLFGPDGKHRPWYPAYTVASPLLLPGSIVRRVESGDRPPKLNVEHARWMIRHRHPTSGLVYPRLNAACARRPDGKWWFGATNASHGSEASTGNLGTHPGAFPCQVTVQVEELRGKSGTWAGKRCSHGGAVSTTSAASVDGHIRFRLAPGETIALVSS